MLSSLQSLRGIFSIFIFMNHIAGFDAGGDVGVAFFLILSGFVLCNGYESKICARQITLRDFLVRRVAKIYPLHILCFLVAVVLQFRLIGFQQLPAWVLNLLLLQSWIPNPDIYFSANAVAWFLSDILFCYAVFPFIVPYVRSRTLPRLFVPLAILLAVYFSIVLVLPERYSNPIIYINPLSRIVDFTLGIVLWQIWQYGHGTSVYGKFESLPYISKSAIELAAVALLAGAFIVYPHAYANVATASLWWIPAIVLISVFTVFDAGGGIVTTLLHKPWLIWFGNISFCFYMIHYLVIAYCRIIFEKLGWSETPWAFLLLCLALSTLGAYLISRYFEKPIENLRRRSARRLKKTA